MQVIIGIDPHKATHTAVAVSGDEDELARLRVRASRSQVEHLLTWAAPFPSRLCAIEGAEGLGFLLAQQLVTAGEAVVDVPATLAARTRVLGTGRSNKNDPNDAMSVAVTALRTRDLRRVQSVGTVRCCVCCRNGTSTSAGNDHARSLGCTHCSWSSRQVASPVKSTFPTHRRSLPASHRRLLSSTSATTWPTISSTTSVGSTSS